MSLFADKDSIMESVSVLIAIIFWRLCEWILKGLENKAVKSNKQKNFFYSIFFSCERILLRRYFVLAPASVIISPECSTFTLSFFHCFFVQKIFFQIKIQIFFQL